MQRALTGSIVAVIISTALFISNAYAQQVEKEGKAWLDTCATVDAAAINVTGLWKDPKWGVLSLNQHENRDIIGSGDGWNISGLVSGNSVCLVFWDRGGISFSAKLTADGSTQLSGGYVKGLRSSKSKTVSMRLVKLVK